MQVWPPSNNCLTYSQRILLELLNKLTLLEMDPLLSTSIILKISSMSSSVSSSGFFLWTLTQPTASSCFMISTNLKKKNISKLYYWQAWVLIPGPSQVAAKSSILNFKALSQIGESGLVFIYIHQHTKNSSHWTASLSYPTYCSVSIPLNSYLSSKCLTCVNK